jgi:hypothetical protein
MRGLARISKGKNAFSERLVFPELRNQSCPLQVSVENEFPGETTLSLPKMATWMLCILETVQAVRPVRVNQFHERGE